MKPYRNGICPDCDGAGSVVAIITNESVLRRGQTKCKFCKGTGKVSKEQYQKEAAFIESCSRAR